jgi:GNAT superfamily N-acetyltransferase
MNSMMHNVLIRPAVMSEAKLWKRCSVGHRLTTPGIAMPCSPTLTIELPRDQIAAGHVFIAERDGAIVGFSAVVPREAPEMDLDGLFVEPRLWRHGIERLLVEYSVAFVREQGAAVLHAVGNPHAQEFYRSCGFELLGTVPTRFGVGVSFRRTV